MRIGKLRQTPVGEEYAGSARSARLEHPIACDEGQIVWACVFKAGQTGDAGLWRADQFSSDDAMDLCQGNGAAWTSGHGLGLLLAFRFFGHR